MAECKHLLFFNAKDLTKSDEELIGRYFKVPLEKVGDEIYKISFKDQEEQERVLQKKFHTVPLPKRALPVTVTRTVTSVIPSIKSKKLTKPNSEAMEKKIHMDLFLLQFLRESSEAFKTLETQLLTIGCTKTIDLEKKELVVKSVHPVGGSESAEECEQKVSKIFTRITETYLSHYVTDQRQKDKLRQDLSFTSDNLKVYMQNGHVVIVGKVEAVKARVQILENSLPSRKVLEIEEKQYKMVELDFHREMLTHHPTVKINRNSETVILEGSDAEVQEGASKLEKWIKKIHEKRVSLCPTIIDFLNSSGALQKYKDCFQQNFRNPVSIEVGPEVLLSSLSTDALEEAENTLLTDLKLTWYTVQHSILDLKNLKDILIKAMDEANSNEHKVDVNFIPGLSAPATTEVLLVGNYGSVNKLQEIFQEYQRNQILTQEFVLLPIPDLVECFKEFQTLIGLNPTDVTLNPTSSPNPCVVVSGPRLEVQVVKQRLTSALEQLVSATLLFDGLGALHYFQTNGCINKELLEKSFQVIIREQQEVLKPKPTEIKFKIPPGQRERSKSDPPETPPKPPKKSYFSCFKKFPLSPRVVAANPVNLRIKLGSLEDEQVDVLVAPMLNKALSSTKIGSSLLNKAGNDLKVKFDSLASNSHLGPGDVLQVDGDPSLGCSKIFFIECSPWVKNGTSVQDLKRGLQRCLTLCIEGKWNSVSFPIIGPGIALRFPLGDAVKALTDTIRDYDSFSALLEINIVVKPGYPDSEECYNTVHKNLTSIGNKSRQASFKLLASHLDDIIINLERGVELQLVFGDITKEKTDAVVNSTDFANFDFEGVCKHILAHAGQKVATALKQAKIQRGQIFQSGPGRLACKAILHMCGEKDAVLVEQLSSEIIDHCERYQFKSVAIPALCAGVGGLLPDVVAKAILRGIITATSSRTMKFITTVRLILYKINVFSAFKEEAKHIFSSGVIEMDDGTLHLSPRPLNQNNSRRFSLPPAPVERHISFTTSDDQKTKFLFLGLSKDKVDGAQNKLKDLYQSQCSSQSFGAEDLKGLKQIDRMSLKRLIPSHGLCIQEDSSGNLTVEGLKDGVNQAKMIIYNSQKKVLKDEIRAREEQELYEHVAWCIMGNNGQWVRLPPTANYQLEKPDMDMAIVDADGITWEPDLQRMKAKRVLSEKTQMLKRLEIEPDFSFPLYWDNMAKGERSKIIELSPSSGEYQRVKAAFRQTVRMTIIKIQRLQNIPLRRAYEVHKKNLSYKNAEEGGANERQLFHGTPWKNINSIVADGFNHRFAGQNATSFGIGTYFAVQANYSANPKYAIPDADGSQFMFVALVLTGVHVIGHVDMKVLPPRNPQQSLDGYDSAVDNQDHPQLFVVFKDNQAYPDYLITFKQDAI